MTAQPAVTPFNIVTCSTRSVSIFFAMEDEYTEYMSCVKEFLIHGSHRRGISRCLRDAVGKATRDQKYEVDGSKIYFTNSFTIADKNRLYSLLASGAPIPMEFEMDVLRAEALG